MRLGPLFRVLGTLVYGFIGWELGVALAQTNELNTVSIRYILPCTLIGALIGYILSPWLVIGPARAARNALRQVPIGELLAGTIGLAIGLLIAALLTFPISRLPPPFGNILPLDRCDCLWLSGGNGNGPAPGGYVVTPPPRSGR